MAQRHIVQLVDDLDGSPLESADASTIEFGLDGKTYESDLGSANAEKLRSAFAPFIKVARVTSSTRGRSAGGRSSSGDLQAIRAWASANGHTVGDRGRIPAAIRDAYEAAH